MKRFAFLLLPFWVAVLFAACGESRIEYRDRLQSATTTCDDAGSDADDGSSDSSDEQDGDDAGDAQDEGDASDAADSSDAADAADAWDPTQEPGLLLYLDSDRSFAPSVWADQSGHGNDATQSDTTKQPASVAGYFNGHPSVHFTAGQFMQFASLSRTTNTTIALFGRTNVNNSYRCAIQLNGLGLYGSLPGNVWGSYVSATVSSGSRDDGGFRAMLLLSTAANNLTFRTDGVSVTKTNGVAYLANPGRWLGQQSANGYPFDGDIAGVLVYDHVVSTPVAQQIEAWAYVRWSQPSIIATGNSLVHGQLPATTSPSTYWSFSKPVWKLNMGAGGNTTTAMIANAATQEDLRYYPPPGTPKTVVVMLEARNDIVVGGKTAQQAWDNYCNYCLARRAVGHLCVMSTLPPSGSLSNTTRAAFNALAHANWQSCNASALADLAADPQIGPDGANLNTAYFEDGVHLTDLGNQIAGGIQSAAVNTLLN